MEQAKEAKAPPVSICILCIPDSFLPVRNGDLVSVDKSSNTKVRRVLVSHRMLANDIGELPILDLCCACYKWAGKQKELETAPMPTPIKVIYRSLVYSFICICYIGGFGAL